MIPSARTVYHNCFPGLMPPRSLAGASTAGVPVWPAVRTSMVAPLFSCLLVQSVTKDR